MNFSLNESVLRRRVRNDEGEWDTAGRRNEVDQIIAFIDQVTLRDLMLWKADLQRLLEVMVADPEQHLGG